jgi:glutathione S-transferase
MATILFYAPMSSATPVVWALTELGVPYEGVKLDLKQNEQKQPAFLKLNPNGKVPTLVVDGTPLFEAVAIMQWLGERHGVARKLWPAADDPARLAALSWTTWAYVSFGNTLRGLFTATSDQLDASFHNAAQAEHYQKEAQSLLAILDARLAQQPYLLSGQFSLADLIVAGVVGWASMNKVSLETHPHVRDWLGRCQQRPSFAASWKG